MARSSGACDHRLADVGSGADEHVEDARRQPRLFVNLSEQDRRGGRQLGGLEHHAVARHDGRRALPHRNRPRKIPRRDQADRAQRLANRVGEGVARFRRQRLAVHAETFAGVVLEQRDALQHLAFRFLEDLAFLARQRARDLVDALPGDVGGAPQHAAALGTGRFLPRRKCLHRRIDRDAHVGGGGERILGDHIAGVGGVDVLADLAGRRAIPLPVDVRAGIHDLRIISVRHSAISAR